MRPHVVAVALGLGLVSFVIAACGSSDADSGPCPSDNPNCKEAATIDQGRQSVKTRNCAGCHTDDLAGTATKLGGFPDGVELYPPNLTSDKTGLGTWTDIQIATAIRSGIDETGLQLCPQMNHYPEMNDYEVYSIVKYLKSISAVSRDVPRSVCPPLKLKGEQ